SFLGDVGEGAVAVVVKKDVVAPEATEEVIPAVVVIVADADAGLPAGAGESGFFCHVGESAVAIVFVEMGRGCLASGPLRGESSPIGQVNGEPAVVVVVE